MRRNRATSRGGKRSDSQDVPVDPTALGKPGVEAELNPESVGTLALFTLGGSFQKAPDNTLCGDTTRH